MADKKNSKYQIKVENQNKNDMANNEDKKPENQMIIQQQQPQLANTVSQNNEQQKQVQNTPELTQILLNLMQSMAQSYQRDGEVKQLLAQLNQHAEQLVQSSEQGHKQQMQTNIYLEQLVRLEMRQKSFENPAKLSLSSKLANSPNNKSNNDNVSDTALQQQLPQQQFLQQQQQQQQLQKEIIIVVHPNEHANAYIQFLIQQIQQLNDTVYQDILKKLASPIIATEFQGLTKVSKDKNLKIILFFYHNAARTEASEQKLKQMVDDLQTSLKVFDIKFSQISVVNIINSNIVFTNFENLSLPNKITVQVIAKTLYNNKIDISKHIEPPIKNILDFLKQAVQD